VIAKKIGDKFGGGRHEVVGRRAVDGEIAVTVFEPRGLDERGKIGGVVDVKMSEEDYVELRHSRAALAETKSAAATGIDEDSRLTIDPDQIAAGGAFVLELGTAGAEDLRDYTMSGAGLGWDGRGECC
jgi:hypothetical protein